MNHRCSCFMCVHQTNHIPIRHVKSSKKCDKLPKEVNFSFSNIFETPRHCSFVV